MRIAAKVAKDKEQHPQKFCPVQRCLWRTPDGTLCPRHALKLYERIVAEVSK